MILTEREANHHHQSVPVNANANANTEELKVPSEAHG